MTLHEKTQVHNSQRLPRTSAELTCSTHLCGNAACVTFGPVSHSPSPITGTGDYGHSFLTGESWGIPNRGHHVPYWVSGNPARTSPQDRSHWPEENHRRKLSTSGLFDTPPQCVGPRAAFISFPVSGHPLYAPCDFPRVVKALVGAPFPSLQNS